MRTLLLRAALLLYLTMGTTLNLAPGLRAQDIYQQTAPKTPAPARPAPVAPPLPKVGPDGEALLVKNLRGLVLVGGPREVEKTAPSEAGVRVRPPLRVPDEAALRQILTPRLGQKLTRRGLDTLLRDLVVFYRAHDRPVVNVYVPQQDITRGVVQLVVLEGKVGKLSVTDNRWLSEGSTLREIRLRPGEPILRSDVKRDLDWINRNPFKSADVVFSPGTSPGTTNLQIRAKDRFPVRFYSGWENSGNDLTGDNRWYTGLNWGDAFGLGLNHQLNYQYTFNNDLNLFSAHSGSYVMPLPWHHIATVFGAYSSSQAPIQGTVPIRLDGYNWQVDARYEVPLPGLGSYSHSVSAGFDFKESNSNLAFGGSTISGTTPDINQFTLAYRATAPDRFGYTTAALNGTYSAGGLLGSNDTPAFQGLRSGATPQYAYFNAHAERTTRLPADFSLLLSGTIQAANGNLLPSEQLGVGGYDTVRGYEEREANGDEGYLFSTELRTPPISPGGLAGLPGLDDHLQFLGFWDYGTVSNVRLLAGERDHYNLSSVGAGLRYNLATYVTVRFDYGFQLNDPALPARSNSRGNVGVVFSY